MLIGMMFGGFFWGIIVDFVGRRPGFLSTLSISSFFAFCTALSPNYTILCILITLMGFGVGGRYVFLV
jgi:MFS family permease